MSVSTTVVAAEFGPVGTMSISPNGPVGLSERSSSVWSETGLGINLFAVGGTRVLKVGAELKVKGEPGPACEGTDRSVKPSVRLRPVS